MEIRELPPRAQAPLTEYALVGDGHSAALVGSDGAVDWWCPQRFDAPSVFAFLLDAERGGSFRLEPPVRHARRPEYLDDTAIHRTTFVTEALRARLTTFMPHVRAGHPSADRRRLVRLLEGEWGEADFTLDLRPRFDYARRPPRIEACEGGVLARPHGNDDEALRLAATVPIQVDGERAVATFRLRQGERHAFLLDHVKASRPPRVDDPVVEARAALEREIAYWREWSGRCTYMGPQRDLVVRSLVTLKLLQYAPTGAIVASPTTSLPESPGGARNWDYRFAWLRDGVFTVMALETSGYEEEASDFKRWLIGILRRDAPDRLQMLYHVDGGTELPEYVLDHLDGYRGARPVRVGNAAVEQHQLDTYGEIMMCLHRAGELYEGEDARANWEATRRLVDAVCARWREEDSGIWEMRGRHRDYVYSKAMAGLAVARGLRIAEDHGFDAPVDRWRKTLEEIRHWVREEGFSGERGSFVQALPRKDLDASNVLFPILGFLEPGDRRTVATLERVADDLGQRGLVHRYLVDDLLPGSEGAFLAASFWVAQGFAQLGQARRAREFFDAAAAVAGHLGLLPEEADPLTREPLGNYPQGLSHLALVNAAYALAEVEARSAARQRAP